MNNPELVIRKMQRDELDTLVGWAATDITANAGNLDVLHTGKFFTTHHCCPVN